MVRAEPGDELLARQSLAALRSQAEPGSEKREESRTGDNIAASIVNFVKLFDCQNGVGRVW